MSSKVVNLTVHKNTLAKRKRQELKNDSMRELKELLAACEADSVTIVVIDKEQNTYSYQSDTSFRPAELAVLLRDAIKDVLLSEEVTIDEEQEET